MGLSQTYPWLETPLVSYARARSLHFTVQRLTLFSLWYLTGKDRSKIDLLGPQTLEAIHRSAERLLRKDARHILNGDYPFSVLTPESPVRHLKRFPEILVDAVRVSTRRKSGKTVDLSQKIQEMAEDLPRYYRRNFHFQTDGYFSEKSARRYEHQVEMLFGGMADPMRRMILPPLKKHFGRTDGRGLHFLEIGAGTGRAASFVKRTFPKAKLTVSDLSEPYLKVAAENLKSCSKCNFIQSDGADLPFANATFDGVYSVFLFHELPEKERRAVIAESVRVLKPDGFLGLVDSMQIGDSPELPELESVLRKFPDQFHEPFYRNYLENPIEQVLQGAGLLEINSEPAFLSKVCSGRKSRIGSTNSTSSV